MTTPANYIRLNIYLDDTELKRKIKIAAARMGVTASAYCLEAIKRKLQEDTGESSLPNSALSPIQAAQASDRLHEQIGPIGISVKELIEEGRITVPIEIHQDLRLKEGDEVTIVLQAEEVRLIPKTSVVAATAGIFKTAEKALNAEELRSVAEEVIASATLARFEH